jgi:hypothetical protein
MRIINDLVNGLLELVGAILLLNNCRVLYRHQKVEGVSVTATAYFSCWGMWNLYFYPSNHLWFSFAGAICLTLTNISWVGMAICYRKAKVVGCLIAPELPSFQVSSVGK